MSVDKKINYQDILNAIDLNKINFTDKKKRGRPKKSQQLINPTSISKINISNVPDEQEEIILHLPITKSDIQTFKNKGTTLEDMGGKIKQIQEDSENDSENSDDDISIPKKEKDILHDTFGDKWNDVNQKQYGFIIKKLKDENDKLKKYLTDITPMYFTEVKVYPVDLKIFDKQENILIPKKTNVNCWWCTYNFDCLPTFIPIKYTENKFYVYGCFCSFNCAGAYNLHKNDDHNNRYSLLKQMYYMINKGQITSINEININVAGPKELLEKYGGPMKIEEYRKNSKILGREYHTLMPPFMPINIGFEEITNSKTTNKSAKINDIISINSKEHLVVKRNKPLTQIASKEIDSYIE